MKRLLGLAVLLAASRANAMGVYITVNFVAWSGDGGAALLARDETSSATAGAKHEYILVNGTDKPVAFTFTNTLDPDKAHEQIDKAACTKTADKLTKALAAGKFTGIDVKAASCAGSKRDVVVVSADVAKTSKTLMASSVVTSAKLRIEFSGANGDDSGPAHAAVYVKTVEDLRDAF